MLPPQGVDRVRTLLIPRGVRRYLIASTVTSLCLGCGGARIDDAPDARPTEPRPDASSSPDAGMFGSDVGTDGGGPNRAPIADAGGMVTTWPGRTAVLDGAKSSDPDGDTLTFSWRQTAGDAVTLDDPTSPTPTFVAGALGMLAFELTVSDGELTAMDTAAVEVLSFGGGRVRVADNPFQYGVRVSDPRGLHVDGDYLYATSGRFLRIYDLTVPHRPALATSVRLGGDAFDVTVAGQHAYVADIDDGLIVVDVRDFVAGAANPTRPTVVGTATVAYQARAVAVAGNHAYVAVGGTGITSQDGGLVIFDVSDDVMDRGAGAPREVGFVQTPGNAWQLSVDGQHVYVADRGYNSAPRNTGLRIIDVSEYLADAANPTATIVGQWDASLHVTAVHAAGDLLIVSETGSNVEANDGALRFFDVSDPTNPTEHADTAVDTIGSPGGVALNGARLLVATPYTLEAVDLADFLAGRGDPIWRKGYAGTGVSRQQVVVRGEWAYTAANSSGHLDVIHTAGPDDDPGLVGTWRQPWAPRTNTRATEVLALGDHVATMHRRSAETLQILDASDPTMMQPLLDPAIDLGDLVYRSVVVGDLAYFATATAGMLIYDVADYVQRMPTPMPPRQVAQHQLENRRSVQGVTVTGTVAWLSASGGVFQALDIGDPAMPVAPTTGDLGLLTLSRTAYESVLSNGNAYVANGNDGVAVVDVRDPASPRLRAQHPGSDVQNVALLEAQSGLQFLLVSGADLEVVDISNPDMPMVLGQLDLRTADILVRDGRVFSGGRGVYEIDVSDPAFPHLVGGRSTPGGGGELERMGDTFFVSDFVAGVAAVRLPDRATLTMSGAATASSTVTASFRWPEAATDTLVDCVAAAGRCWVDSLDRHGNEAPVQWFLPEVPGDYELFVAVGDWNSFVADRAQVRTD